MNSDDLLRQSVSKHIDNANGVDDLRLKKDVDLFSMLASRVSDPGTFLDSTNNQFLKSFSVDDLVRSEDMSNLGKRIFMRWSVAIHEFVCKSGNDDKEIKAQIISAIVGKGGGAAAVIAGSWGVNVTIRDLLSTP